MDYCRTTFHVVQQGDTFYRLAQRYHTTVPDIIMRNPGINPYNLQVGTRLRICAGYENNSGHPEQMELNNDMRKAWSQHNFWDAMFKTSLMNSLDNTDAVQKRLMQTPEEIASVFAKFYPQSTVNQLQKLLEEHVRLAGEYTAAHNNGSMERAEQVENQMYQNVDQIARMLANANSKYDYEELRRMMRRHLDLMKNSMMADRNGEHGEAVRMMDENTALLMDLSDALTNGLVEQFYQR